MTFPLSVLGMLKLSGTFVENLIKVNISLKRALCVHPPCTSMAGTQRRSLLRQTNLNEFDSHATSCLEQHQATKTKSIADYLLSHLLTPRNVNVLQLKT